MNVGWSLFTGVQAGHSPQGDSAKSSLSTLHLGHLGILTTKLVAWTLGQVINELCEMAARLSWRLLCADGEDG